MHYFDDFRCLWICFYACIKLILLRSFQNSKAFEDFLRKKKMFTYSIFQNSFMGLIFQLFFERSKRLKNASNFSTNCWKVLKTKFFFSTQMAKSKCSIVPFSLTLVKEKVPGNFFFDERSKCLFTSIKCSWSWFLLSYIIYVLWSFSAFKRFWAAFSKRKCFYVKRFKFDLCVYFRLAHKTLKSDV